MFVPLFRLKLNRLIFLFILCLPACSVIKAKPVTTYNLDQPRLDPILQSKLESKIDELGLWQAVQEKRLNLAFADISNIYQPKIAGLNETNMMYAASLPKIAILLALFKKIENGEIKWTPGIKEQAEEMNRKSSNTAATALYHLVGPEYIQHLLLSDKYHLYDRNLYGGLWIGKEYGSAPSDFPDPIKNLNHAATPFSVLRFYYLLESGQLLNDKLTQTMRETMAYSAYTTKFQKGIYDCCPNSVLLRKAGAWKNFNCDSALVINNNKRYIIVGFTNDAKGEEWLEKLAPFFDSLAGNI